MHARGRVLAIIAIGIYLFLLKGADTSFLCRVAARLVYIFEKRLIVIFH